MADETTYVEQFRSRVIQDALTEATAAYWLRRSRQFERALPRPGDYTGTATPAQLEAQRARIVAVAAACRHRAAVLLTGVYP